MTDTRDDFVISFKPHTGYDSPLVAVKGGNVAEVADKLQAAEAAGLFAIVGRCDASLKAQYELGKTVGAQPVSSPAAGEQGYYQGQQPQQGYAPPAQQAPPQQQAQPAQSTAPGVQQKSCPHGVKVYRTNPPNAAKRWAGWFCPSPKGTPGQCEVEWDNSYGKSG